MRLFFWLLFSFISVNTCLVSAQEERPYQFSLDHFSVGFDYSFNKTQITCDTSAVPFRSGIGRTGEIQFAYNFNFSGFEGIRLTAGLGYYPTILYLTESNFKQHYKNEVSKTLFANFSADYNWRINLPNRTYLGFSAGTGFRLLPKVSTHLAYIDENNDPVCSADLDYGQQPNWYARAGVNLMIPLPNQDLLDFRLHYDYSFAPIMRGDMTAYYTHSGHLVNKGNQIGLCLAYTFTRSKRAESLEGAIFENQEKIYYKEERRKFRIEKRFVPEKSIFISLNSGLGNYYSHSKNTGTNVSPAKAPGWNAFAKCEFNIRKNQYMEGLLGYEDAKIGYTFVDLSGSWSVGLFSRSALLSFGYAWRFSHPKTNHHLITLSTGIGTALRLNETKIHIISGTEIGGYNNIPLTIVQSEIIHLPNRFMPFVYAGIGRDFQLSPGFSLSFTGQFKFGFVSSSYLDVGYTHKPAEGFEDYRFYFRDTGYLINVGLKYRFLQK